MRQVKVKKIVVNIAIIRPKLCDRHMNPYLNRKRH